MNNKSFYRKLIMFFLAAIICVAVYKTATAKTPAEIKTELAEKAKNKLDALKALALANSHQEVKNKLKSPATAEFPYDISHVTQNSKDKFTVTSYVDSQNSFGATIRANYICKITFLPNDRYTCDECILLE